MCDPITIAGIALTAGSAVVNSMAASKTAKARDDVLAAERIRQQSYDREAEAINAQSQDRFKGFGDKQETQAKSLSDMFTQPATPAAPGAANQAAASAMPSSNSGITVQNDQKQADKATAFTNQQGQSLGELRAFGQLLGDTSRLQARDASLVGQIGGFKKGSSSVVPYELENASHAGDGMKMFGDIMGGIGSMATGYGLTKGPSAGSNFASSAASPYAFGSGGYSGAGPFIPPKPSLAPQRSLLTLFGGT